MQVDSAVAGEVEAKNNFDTRTLYCTLYLLACQVRVAVGDSGLYGCVHVTSSRAS